MFLVGFLGTVYNMVTCPDFAVIFAVLIIDYKF